MIVILQWNSIRSMQYTNTVANVTVKPHHRCWGPTPAWGDGKTDWCQQYLHNKAPATSSHCQSERAKESNLQLLKLSQHTYMHPPFKYTHHKSLRTRLLKTRESGTTHLISKFIRMTLIISRPKPSYSTNDNVVLTIIWSGVILLHTWLSINAVKVSSTMSSQNIWNIKKP